MRPKPKECFMIVNVISCPWRPKVQKLIPNLFCPHPSFSLLAAAFKALNLQILISTVASLDFRSYILTWLFHHSHKIDPSPKRVGFVSSPHSITSVVAQGLALGPLLLFIHTKSLGRINRLYGYSYCLLLTGCLQKILHRLNIPKSICLVHLLFQWFDFLTVQYMWPVLLHYITFLMIKISKNLGK